MFKKSLLILSLVAISLAFNLQNENIIRQVNSAKTTWEAGFNRRFASMSMDEIRSMMGTRLDTPDYLKLDIKKPTLGNEQIPDNFDSREQWPNCESIKEIRDQSTCGSCWAFGAAEAMSDRWCIAHNQQSQDRISAEDLLECCGFLCGMGCNGGFPASAWRYFKNTGLVTGGLYGDDSFCKSYTLPPCDHHISGKYQPCSGTSATPKCTKKCSDKSGKDYAGDKKKAKTVFQLSSNVSEIQKEIMQNGPVEAAFTVYEDFLAYKTGVYQHVTGSALGGHAIKVLGWGVENNIPYWLVANSWNEDWGDKGFFKILRGSNHCGIESQMVGGTI